MNTLVAVLAFIYIISIKAESLQSDSADDGDDSIENIIMEGDKSRFSAVVIMKPPTKTQENNPKPDDTENLNTMVPYILQGNNEPDNTGELSYRANEEEDVLPIRFLRRKPWKSCLKSASKVCKKACITAHKDMCAYNKCKSRMKKRMKKECKRSCKSFFEGDDDYDEGSSE